jgi:hypothetical protein
MLADAGNGGGAAIGAAMGASAGMFLGFAKGAAEGSFAVNETGGKALLQAIREMKDWVDENRVDLQRLADQPALGGSHAADAMKQFVPQVASDSQGFLTQLMKFRESLEQAEQGINTAMTNYQNMDHRGAERHR